MITTHTNLIAGTTSGKADATEDFEGRRQVKGDDAVRGRDHHAMQGRIVHY